MGSAQRIKEVAKLVTARGCNIIVLSAMSGTTNTLVEISDYLYHLMVLMAEKGVTWEHITQELSKR